MKNNLYTVYALSLSFLFSFNKVRHNTRTFIIFTRLQNCSFKHHLLFDRNNLCFDRADLWFRSYELSIEGTFRVFIKFYLWKKVRREDENSQANWWLTLVLSRSICSLPGPVNLPIARPLMNLLNLRSNWLDTNDNAQLSILIVSKLNFLNVRTFKTLTLARSWPCSSQSGLVCMRVS